MRVLVLYDVCTSDPLGPRRLRQVARACQDYGQRVQKSVFECSVGDVHWIKLRDRLLKIIDPDHDSLRFYFLDTDTIVEHHGTARPPDLDGPLII
jgi:CRISPR-associated protein Cas2